jgi:hypothetical protein
VQTTLIISLRGISKEINIKSQIKRGDDQKGKGRKNDENTNFTIISLVNYFKSTCFII